MKETYVTLEQAQALKRLGFDWECDHRYFRMNETPTYVYPPENWNTPRCDMFCNAPALHIAQKWLREVKQYEANAFRCTHRYQWNAYSCAMEVPALSPLGILDDDYETYEEALSAAITIALKRLEGKI